MIPIVFHAKRSFHASLRVARELVAPFGLTPARFDLLSVIYRSDRVITQRDLRDILGVSGPTISRMVRSLEDLGLLRRGRYWGDLRQREVALTSEGSTRVRDVFRAVIRVGYVQLAVDSALAPDRVFDARACASETEVALAVFKRFGQGLGDRATHRYPWDAAA